MNPHPSAAAPDPDCAAVACLVLEGCHALDSYLAHPCDVHADDVAHARAALLAAANRADEERCDDALAIAAELEDVLGAIEAHMEHRGAA